MSGSSSPDDDADVHDALSAMQAAYDDAASAIEAMLDPQRAFERATALREAADQLVGEAANLRARMAERIWKTEEMSLASLANRIGISKARADQLLKTAKESRTTKET